MTGWQKLKVFVGGMAAVMLFGATAHAIVLTFDGNICGNGVACFNGGNPIDQTYGDIAGKLDIVYTSRVSNGPAASAYDFLKWWDNF